MSDPVQLELELKYSARLENALKEIRMTLDVPPAWHDLAIEKVFQIIEEALKP